MANRLSKTLILLAFLPAVAWSKQTTLNEISGKGATSQESLKAPTAPVDKSWVYNWNARIFGLGVNDDTEDARVSGAQIYGDVAKKFNPYLDTAMGLRARFSTGSTHSLYALNRVENGIQLDQAFLNLNPIPRYATVTLGAINQRFLQNPLLVDELSFPAVRERLSFESKSFYVGVMAQQAIPASSSLSTRTVEKEPMPSFFTETAMFAYSPVKAVIVKGRGGRFTFNDLPSQVAFESYAQGNLVDADVPQSARFEHEFSGWTYGGEISAKLTSKLSVAVGADALTNEKAPSEYADGLLSFGEAKFQVTKSWSAIPRFEYFRNERHSSPAFYNSADYGHNNRHGYSYEVRVQSPSEGMAFKAKYTDSRLIEEDPLQANSQIMMLYLELSDEVL